MNNCLEGLKISMNNIFKILRRLNEVYVKQRVLLIYLVVQNTILALIMLIYANVIISNGKINGELDYSQIRFFYNLAILLLFLIILIFTPILISNSLNNLYKRNIIEHLLSVRISMGEIVYAVFFRGISTLIVLLFSAFPIVVISFYFGGFGMFKLFRLLWIILSYAVLYASICQFISTRIIDANTSMIVSYVIGIILSVINIYYLDRFLNNQFWVIPYVIFNIILALIMVSMSRKTKIFNA